MTYNVQLSVIVRGSGLWGSNFEFVRKEGHDEVQYTPLGGSPDAPLFIITDNGVYRIYANGQLYRTITVEGMVIPDASFRNIYAYQSPGGTLNIQDCINEMVTSERCLNYPYKVSEDYPNFLLRFVSALPSGLPPDTFVYEGCTRVSGRASATSYYRNIVPTNDGLPCVIRYQGVIIFVGNYEQQRRRRR